MDTDTPGPFPPRISASSLSVGYTQQTPILTGIDVTVPPGLITVLVGANGSGKSTLLRTLGNALAPLEGTVRLGDDDISHVPRRTVARTLSMLPQTPVAPDGVTVRELCEFGRHPHRGFLHRATPSDRLAVQEAIDAAGLADRAEEPIDTLSGGQRQRAWIAMSLAQRTPIMFLDEPTTYLDISHQIEVLDLLHRLNRDHGTTIVMVLHDLNHAAHYAHHVIAVSEQNIHAAGPPTQVLTSETIRTIFGVEALVTTHPVTGSPLCLPLPGTPGAHRLASGADWSNPMAHTLPDRTNS